MDIMINEITYNPYRILGLYSNSSTREQVAHKGKLQAYLKVNKSMSFPLDLTTLLPQLSRTSEMVQEADSKLILPKDRVKHAQFWFIKQSSIDEIAFNHLIAGNIIKAKEIWSKVTNMSSLQNQFVLELICARITDERIKLTLSDPDDYGQAVDELKRMGQYGTVIDAINKYLIPIYNEHFNEFVSSISDNFKLSKTDFISNVIDSLVAEDYSLSAERIANKEWADYIIFKNKHTFLHKIEESINETESQLKTKEPERSLRAGIRLKDSSKLSLKNLRNTLGESDTQYQLIADKVAMTIIDCMVAYYNNSKDEKKPQKALPLCEYAVEIAKGVTARERAKTNLENVKRAYDDMPPESVIEYKKQIDRIFDWFDKQKSTAANGLELLKRARFALISIKETLGTDHSYYRRISSAIANAALDNVIAEVNVIMRELNENESSLMSRYGIDSPFSSAFDSSPIFREIRRKDLIQKLKPALSNAWETILLLDLFDTTDDFKKKRFLPNRSTLRSIIQSASGFEMPNGALYSTVGCCYWIKVDPDFLTTDSELYSRCKDIDSYKNYIAHYPSGKHAEEIRLKIEAAEKRKRLINFAIIAATIIGAIAIIAAFVNASSNRSSSERLYDDTVEVVEAEEEQSNFEYEDSTVYPEDEGAGSYPEDDNTYSYSEGEEEGDEMTDEERYFAQFSNFEPSSSDVQGGVVYEGSGDYYIVETNRGYAIAERYSGMLYEGQTIYGRLNSYGMKYFINLSRDTEVKLYIEDYMLSQDQAIEWMGSHRHLKYTDQSRYDQANDDW